MTADLIKIMFSHKLLLKREKIENIKKALAENKDVIGTLKDGRVIRIESVVDEGAANINEEIVSIKIN